MSVNIKLKLAIDAYKIAKKQYLKRQTKQWLTYKRGCCCHESSHILKFYNRPIGQLSISDFKIKHIGHWGQFQPVMKVGLDEKSF